MARLLKWTLLSVLVWIGCGSVAPNPEGGTAGSAGTGADAAAGAGGTTGAGGRGGSGVACGILTCQPGAMCCFDINGGNPTCANPPAVCIGAPQNCNNASPCPNGLFCDSVQPRRCVASGTNGMCIQPPTACDRLYDPVCGCDGTTYGNDCMRRMAKVQLDHVGECGAAAR